MSEIHKVEIVGGGTMGIAAAVAQAGMDVLLCEKDQASAESALVKIAEEFDHEITRWALTAGDKRALLKKISVHRILSRSPAGIS
jgi:3-hydroxyacyl-CoA dehydrogenase